jgi:asparagine synthase (glutamine-hydrolysing)
MIEVLRHRGPDDIGFFLDERIGLANARLSIIDIEGGHQPMQNEDGTVHVTYNGEIYNFQELRHDLESQGHRFNTKSDTEVILHSYEQYGEAFLPKLNGMFAIALWDSRQKKLVLARDRMGIKPLHYIIRNDTILFASEIKGILQAPLVRVVDEESLYAILNLGYIPGNKTLLKGVYKLPPSSFLIFQDKAAKVSSYWRIPPIKPVTNEDLVVDRLRLVLEEAVRDQLVADVPVGCFLSGGLDSSAIVAYASRASSQPLKTFCMGFGEETDEFRDARLIADRFGTDHRELLVDSSQGMKLYPTMIWHMEAPKYNLYPWFVCELVRQHVKVCLSGNGGDEVFGGYIARYQNALKIERLSEKPFSPILKVSGSILGRFSEDVRTKNRLRVLQYLGDNTIEYLTLFGALPDQFNRELFRNDGYSIDDLRGHYSVFFENIDFLQGLMNAELRTKLVDDLLSVDDAMSMAHSLELRVPLLDNRIVDLMTTVPWQMKYSPSAYGKLLLRKAIGDILPQESLRKPKWGFSVDVYNWFKGELGELVRQILPESDVLRKYFSQSFVRKLLSRPMSARDRRYQVLLWQLLGFHFWHRIFIDSERAGAARLEVDALVA